MDEKIIFSIGEALIMEVEDIANVTYPRAESPLRSIIIETNNGKRYDLVLKEVV